MYSQIALIEIAEKLAEARPTINHGYGLDIELAHKYNSLTEVIFIRRLKQLKQLKTIKGSGSILPFESQQLLILKRYFPNV